MTLEEMKNKKTELGLTNEMISQSSGIPLSTIQKIMSAGFESISPKPEAIWSGVPLRKFASVTIL